MKNQSYIVLAAILFLSIGTFHILASVFFWYIAYWWLDIPMHFFGGVWCGFVGIWFYHVTVLPEHRSRTKLTAYAFGGAVLFGVLWEWYEYVVGLTWNAIGNYTLDTVKDLLFDFAGGYLAALFYNETVSQQPSQQSSAAAHH